MQLPLVRRWRRISRGQALVEMAIIMPVLLLLLVMAIDLGRVFFGWVGLQNAARIGASYAAQHSTSWVTPDNAVKVLARAQYAEQIIADARALNCDRDVDGDGDFDANDLPLPVFVNVAGTANPREMGDHATVTLNCTFSLITPLADAIFGGGVDISAEAVFPVRAGTIAGIPTPDPNATPTPTPFATPTPTPSGPTPTPTPTPAVPTPTPTPNPCQAPIANFAANRTSGHKPLTVTFTDNSQPIGCPITGWAWDFDSNGTVDASSQNASHTYAIKGNYSVRLTVTSAGGSNSTVVNNYIHVSN
jgi:cell division septation protein DedD